MRARTDDDPTVVDTPDTRRRPRPAGERSRGISRDGREDSAGAGYGRYTTVIVAFMLEWNLHA